MWLGEKNSWITCEASYLFKQKIDKSPQKVARLKEIAYEMGYIQRKTFELSPTTLKKNQYGQYLIKEQITKKDVIYYTQFTRTAKIDDVTWTKSSWDQEVIFETFKGQDKPEEFFRI